MAQGRQCEQPAPRCGSRPGRPSSSSTQRTHTPCSKHGRAKLPAWLRAPRPPCTKQVPHTRSLALPCSPFFLPEAHLRPEAKLHHAHAHRPWGAGGAGQRAATSARILPTPTRDRRAELHLLPRAKCAGTAQPPARKRRLIHYLLFPALIVSVKLLSSVAFPAPVTWLVGHSSTLAEFLADSKEGSWPSVS